MVGAYRSMKRSPSLLRRMPPSPRAPSVSRMPRPARPVGWNWKNSMSSSGSPAPDAMPMPSPVRVCAFEVVLKNLPKPPVAKITALAWKTWISPVASSYATTPAVRVSAVDLGDQQVEDVELVEELHAAA